MGGRRLYAPQRRRVAVLQHRHGRGKPHRDPRTPGIPLRHARPRLAALLYLFHLPHRLYAHVRPHHSSQRDEIRPEKRAHRARQD